MFDVLVKIRKVITKWRNDFKMAVLVRDGQVLQIAVFYAKRSPIPSLLSMPSDVQFQNADRNTNP
jgi:hypothetical protein